MRNLLLVILTTLVFNGWCQVSDTTSLAPVKDTIHSPKKAMTFSAILPGAGQFYNHFAKPKGKRYGFIKAPLIYAGLGATAFFTYSSWNEADRTRLEYFHRIDNNGESKFDEYAFKDLDAIILEHKMAKRQRDLSIVGFVLVWGLNILDAGVEAHFVNFDISPDLSLNIRPQLFTPSTYGVSLAFKFR